MEIRPFKATTARFSGLRALLFKAKPCPVIIPSVSFQNVPEECFYYVSNLNMLTN